MLISLVINCDTRPERSSVDKMFSGVVNEDFLTDGLFNKIKFFEGFDLEVIMYVDEHLPIPEETLNYIRSLATTVVIRKHTEEHLFNDLNYVRALQMATGDIIRHFDQDTAAFTGSKESVDFLIGLLDKYAYVSYPSHWSPIAVKDDSFNYRWASTRFFMCKKETLNFPEIVKCLTDYEYFCQAYSPSRICPWLEHVLGLIADSNVFYPPIETEKYSIFSWGSYDKYILRRLNELPYEEIKKFVYEKKIQYPVDLFV